MHKASAQSTLLDSDAQFAAVLTILHETGDPNSIMWLARTHPGPLGEGARHFLREEYGLRIELSSQETRTTAAAVEEALFQAELALLDRKSRGSTPSRGVF